MNKRIRELAEQATDKWVGGEFFDREKFAELIVQECANIAQSIGEHGHIASQEMFEYFGLEESKGWVCPKCGVDRTRSSCPSGHSAAITGECPMFGVAFGVEK